MNSSGIVKEILWNEILEKDLLIDTLIYLTSLLHCVNFAKVVSFLSQLLASSAVVVILSSWFGCMKSATVMLFIVFFCESGSPFNVAVGGEPSSRMTERITRHREAADITHIGSQCELSLKIPGMCSEESKLRIL